MSDDPVDGGEAPAPEPPDGEGTPDAAGPFEAPGDGEMGPPPGVEPEGDEGGTSSLMESLTATEPDTPLSDIESPWNPEEGGEARLYRGFQKATGTDGVPAWVDLLIGAAEVAVTLTPEEGAEPGDPAEPEPDDDGPDRDMGGEVAR